MNKKRMNINHIDFYHGVHGLSNPALLTETLKQWVKSAKQRKLIRAFGFSTHKNMDKCMMAASKLNWIYAIMTSYNFILMQKPEMQEAVSACYKARIGLIAMKVQSSGQKFEDEESKKLAEHFLKEGFTDGQAKIKIVLEDERFTSACVGMATVPLIELFLTSYFIHSKFPKCCHRGLIKI